MRICGRLSPVTAAARFYIVAVVCRHEITLAGGSKPFRRTRGAHLSAGWRPRAAGGEGREGEGQG